MQFTKAEEYGMFGVLFLAETDRSRVVPLSKSPRPKTSGEVPGQDISVVSKSGIIRSHRGVRGGFSLAKDQVK